MEEVTCFKGQEVRETRNLEMLYRNDVIGGMYQIPYEVNFIMKESYNRH